MVLAATTYELLNMSDGRELLNRDQVDPAAQHNQSTETGNLLIDPDLRALSLGEPIAILAQAKPYAGKFYTPYPSRADFMPNKGHISLESIQQAEGTQNAQNKPRGSRLMVDPETGKPSFKYTSMIDRAKADQSTGNPNPPGATADGVGGLGTGMKKMEGTFRATSGANNGNTISFKHYPSGWQGGSRAKITTYDMTKTGGALGKASFVTGVGLGVVDVLQSYKQDGDMIGVNTQRATGRTAGSMTGSWAGAWAGTEAGATICFWSGVGVLPCAIVGGIAGGIIGGQGGSILGEETAKLLQEGGSKNEDYFDYLMSGQIQ